MANPNIVNVSTITGKTSVLQLTTSLQTIVSNSTSSGKVIKVDSLFVSNTSTNIASVTVDVLRGSANYKIASTIVVPVNASLVVIDKTSNIFLEEGDTLRANSSSANTLQLVASYEEIS